MPIGNITQIMSTISPPPHRGVDVQSVFVNKQEDFQDHLADITIDELNTLKDQLNTRIGEINSTATTMNGYADTASAGASTATTKAGEASTSASGALTSRNQASTSATNSSNSAIKASQWAENNYNAAVETGKYSAKHWATVAQNVVEGTVKLTENQTVTGVKTFTSSPIVPTPTTDFQSVPLRSTNITVNVGAGQTYTTINQALEYLSGFYPMYKKSGVTATINLKAGFVMAEQVLVSGIDLGWITIVGEDAETIITHTALTIGFNGPNYPAFGVDKGGTSPIIGQLFRFNVEKKGEGKHGLMTYGAGSSADVLPDKGFIGAGTYGIYAYSGSTINAQGANCSNAGIFGIYANSASTINANGANCSNAGNYGIYALSASTINANGANCSNAAMGIVADRGSIIDAVGANCNNARSIGVFAQAASIINFFGANCSNAGTHGIYAYSGSTINAQGANCSNAGNYGIYAVDGSTINANGAIVQNQTTGTVRVAVSVGSTINAYGINTTGGTVPVLSQAVNTLTSNGIIYQ